MTRAILALLVLAPSTKEMRHESLSCHRLHRPRWPHILGVGHHIRHQPGQDRGAMTTKVTNPMVLFKFTCAGTLTEVRSLLLLHPEPIRAGLDLERIGDEIEDVIKMPVVQILGWQRMEDSDS